ncbi:YdcF family protein [Pectinatus sottacetonis]|uniref:YdcF family protein n=1 Tax=Pectinatus sottacetonis TaxID=1002795 RepID=UPI0018C6945C|nr:YdcF family protein [Pectinatus sottacetonis]
MKEIIKNINLLGQFCGERNLKALTASELNDKYGLLQADIMVLFGGSIISGGDIMAAAIKNKIAKKYIIVGGAGHTTNNLRHQAEIVCPGIQTAELSEAEIFTLYLKYKYNVTPDLLECRSTNCGNNITYLLSLLQTHKIPFNNMIITQDATMQKRMEAGLRKYLKTDITIINFAAYTANITIKNGQPAFEHNIPGMWSIEQYITLLMGEIPRLSDNKTGYGPRGKNYIAHVDIPLEVATAFTQLKKTYGSMIRKANPLYSS